MLIVAPWQRFGLRLAQRAMHAQQGSGLPLQLGKLPLEWQFGKATSALEHVNTPPRPHRQLFTEHGHQRGNAHACANQHQGPIAVALQGEAAHRQAHLQRVADGNLFMQVTRCRALRLDADAQMAIGRRAGQAVGSNQWSSARLGNTHGNMLTGSKGNRSIGRQVERTDIAAFLLYPQHAPRQPLALPLTLLQALFGFCPGAGHQAGRRVFLKGPAQGNSRAAQHYLFDHQRPKPLGAFESLDQRAVEDHFGATSHL